MGQATFDGFVYETRRVEVPGGAVETYTLGEGQEVVFILHGGPGMSCDYVRDSHARLAGDRYRLVTYDQLGCGASERPNNHHLWTLERSVQEVEAVRTALGLGTVHLLGQSWGAFLSVEYALTHPGAIKTLTLEGGSANIPHLRDEMDRLRMALGSETVTMMVRHEAEGSFDHPEYKAAIEVLMYRHVCRLQQWPPSLMRSISNFNTAFFGAIQGRNEFTFTGNLRDWNRIPDLPQIKQPVLVMCGYHDEVTPACAAMMCEALPNGRLHVFSNSAHVPFLEEPADYFAVLGGFLDEHTRTPR